MTMQFGLLDYFTDPVLRGPTIGCMLMCMAAAMVGVIVFLRKESLLGESLSHAAYPGVILGVITAGLLGYEESDELSLAVLVMGGAFMSALLGLASIHYLEKRLKVRSDSALCFVLSAFFGIGLTLASEVQFSFTSLYRLAQAYLYGQAASMTDYHIGVYGILCLLIMALVVFLYKELQLITFDRDYAKSLGIQASYIDTLVFVLIVLAVVIGIRSVGVVLMSAMLIAPAAAARQYTHRMDGMLGLSAFFGLVSGFFGNYLSVTLSEHPLLVDAHLAWPTGPMIVVVASIICLLSLMFAPERGLFLRLIRITRFRYTTLCENILKTIWRQGSDNSVSFEDIAEFQSASTVYLKFILWQLQRQGWVSKKGRGYYQLTSQGRVWAARIVRLHRLWEVYLAYYLGVGSDRVHRSAEEMEHIITPQIEQELTLLLKDPKQDPHHQPIPPNEKVFHESL